MTTHTNTSATYTKLLRLLVVVFALMVVVTCLGCDIPAQSTIGTTNNEADVEVLFVDDDGFSVKRFRDGGSTHYYVTPVGSVEKNWTTTSGKTTQHHSEAIPTAEKVGN